MKHRRAYRTEGKAESTVHMDIEQLKIDDVSVRVFDCAGQVGLRRKMQTCARSKRLMLSVPLFDSHTWFGAARRGALQKLELRMGTAGCEVKCLCPHVVCGNGSYRHGCTTSIVPALIMVWRPWSFQVGRAACLQTRC